MMGEQTGAQEALFFGFCIEGHVLLIVAEKFQTRFYSIDSRGRR
jgi:hypothetical protein